MILYSKLDILLAYLSWKDVVRMSPETIVSIVLLVLVVMLFAPVRFIKDPEGGSRLTVLEWISQRVSRLKREIAEAKKAQADAEKLLAESQARRKSTDQSDWRWVGGKSAPKRAYPAEGIDEDTTTFK